MLDDFADNVEQQALAMQYEIRCSNGHQFAVLLRDLLTGSVKCAECGGVINVDTSQYEQEMERAKQALHDLQESLNELGNINLKF